MRKTAKVVSSAARPAADATMVRRSRPAPAARHAQERPAPRPELVGVTQIEVDARVIRGSAMA